jgi:hypothetical protein
MTARREHAGEVSAREAGRAGDQVRHVRRRR